MTARRPQIWIVAGPNGAGKTSLTAHRVAGSIPIINPDEIAQHLPRIDGRLDERRAAVAALRERSRRLAAHETFAIETTLSGHGPLNFIRQASVANYKVNLVFVGVDEPTLSLQRVADRVASGGHDVPPDAIVRRYDDAMSKLGTAFEIAERTYIFDNSGERRRLLLARESGRTKFAASDVPAWARSALPSDVWDIHSSGIPPAALAKKWDNKGR